MSGRHQIGFIALFALMVFGMIFLLRTQPTDRPKESSMDQTQPPAVARPSQPPAETPSPPVSEKQSPDVPPPPASVITSAEIQAIRSAAPDLETVREEVRQNPHVTPQSLIDFATSLGPPMEKALRELAAAETLTEELRACAWNESLAASARALCLANTQKLAEAHPRLKNEAEETRDGTPDEVIDLSDR